MLLVVVDKHHRCFNYHLIMILYLSVLSFLIKYSNAFPCNVLQIYVLYHGIPVIQPDLWFFISYFNCSCVSIIHKIPTWYNILFNTNKDIISWYVVLILFVYIIVYFPQLLHHTAIFPLNFDHLPPDYTKNNHKH